MSKRQTSILREIQLRKRDTPSLGCASSLSTGTGLTEESAQDHDISIGQSRDSASYDSKSLEAPSATTTTLLELMNDDNNACKCDMADLMGLDDASLASDHGLVDVKEDEYWFDEESDPSDDSDSSESECETSTKISGDEEDVVQTESEDSEDSLINGIVTIDLQPKISTQDRLYSDDAASGTVSVMSTLKVDTQRVDTIETLSDSASESISIDEKQPEESDVESKSTQSSKDTNEVIEVAKASMSVSISSADSSSELAESVSLNEKLVVELNSSASGISQGSATDKKTTKIFSRKSNANSSDHRPLRKQSSGYISPRQQLAHKCLQDALRVIKREDAANASMNSTSMGRADLHSLTNTGCVMMLKKKERDEMDKGGDRERECELELEENIIEREDDEQRDDRSTTQEDRNEERDDSILNSGSTAVAPSLSSYIGTVTGSSINDNSPIDFNEQPIDPPSSDSQEDSQYLPESDSTTGLSYIGTAVMQGTPKKNLTALNSEDRITDVPQYSEKKMPKDKDIDLIQVETTPTDDETISLDAAGSQSLSIATPKAASQDSNELQHTPSQDSVDEENDTLSPLPPQNKVLDRPCYSPARSFATSIAPSSASTSVSDVFGMLRTSLPSSSESQEVIPATSSAEDSEEMLAADLLLLKQDISTLTSNKGYNISKKERSKSMSSMHVPEDVDCTLTLGNALIATNIFTPPRGKTKTLGGTPSTVGATQSKRDQSELNYGSIGATTFSPLRAQQPSRPESVVFGAVTSPTPSMFSGYTDVHEDKTFLSIAEDIETNTRKRANSMTTPVINEMKVLTIAEEMVSEDGSDVGSEDSALDVLAPMDNKKPSGLQDYLDNKGGSLSATSDPSELHERVKWLEKVLGVNRGGANRAFEDTIIELKQKLSIVEQRLEEEMELKSTANNLVQSLQAKLGGLNEEKVLVDRCLRNQCSSLKSQLAFEKIKAETAESDVKAALASVMDLGLAIEKKEETIAELTKINQQSSKRQAQLESDLVSCAQSNDNLRSRLASMAQDKSTKDNTLSSALGQLKTLSEKMYHIQKELDDEKKGRRDEVEALQFSLDDVSRQMLNMSKKMHSAETENESLRREVKRLKAEKEQTQKMRRSARGF